MNERSDTEGPLARRLKAAGLGTLAEEEERRIASEVQELEDAGHLDVAEMVRERTRAS